ncbi:phage portal protein [Castellaniella ginsengisoli]|uniref:Phage portal protein n=1 Tax=Castellaniella ginsengisoli TaxID=546114 RepID=A0AB39ER52_9BURK
MANLTVLGALRGALTRQKALSPVGGTWRNAWRIISEPFAGAWQKNAEEKRGDLLTYPTLYACIYRISSDIGKLPFRLMQLQPSGVWSETSSSAYSPVLRKPNGYQTANQFRESWMLSKLIQGNTYVLKRRDNRGVVVDLYVLDPQRVLPMVSDAGYVYYQLQTDALNSLPADYPADQLVVPASEIIHDRCMTVHHPLVGVPPLAAAYWPALKNMKIMRSATDFFTNNAQPGGILSGPAGMTEADADKLKAYWNENFTGPNAGRVAVIGADVKFTSFAMKSIDAQMIEQMKYSDEQICQPFGMPPFKVGIGTIPAALSVDGLNQLYYADALQPHIEHMEALLDDGLKIDRPLGVELNLEPLLRMDEGKRAEVATKLVGGGVETPNEGRSRFNRPPLEGGDTVYMQQQDIPLEQARLNTIKRIEAPADPDPDADAEEIRAFMNTQKAITAMKKAMGAAHDL